MNDQTDRAVLAAIAEKIAAMAPMAERAARHRALVASTNAIVSSEADLFLTMDADPRGFERMLAADGGALSAPFAIDAATDDAGVEPDPVVELSRHA
jgi:hypothetical protein